jgi:hypothetical protein
MFYLSIITAVKEAASHLDLTRQLTSIKLIEACGARQVPAYQHDYAGRFIFIDPDRWKHAAIDFRDEVVVFGDQRMHVAVDGDVFKEWLGAEATANGSTKKTDGGYKSKLARKAATTIWGAAGPPADLPPQQVFKRVADKIAELNPGMSIGKSQVLRALKR